MAIRPRPEIEAVEPAVHGGLNYVELERWGLKPEEIIDFSVNINPFGPSPRAPAALAKARLDRYPDSQAVFLRRRLAEVNGLDPENIIVGNGTTEIIRLLALTYLRPGDGVLIVGPTFGEYRVASQLMGARIVTYTAPKECAFWPDISEITSLIQRESPRLIFLCNPNNPTGVYLKRREVEDILAACRGSLPVLDEAYRAFVTGAWSSASLIKGGSLIILRSMTKDHALAGLRLGYALGDAEVVASLRKAQPPWSVNAAAQAVGLAALDDGGHLKETLAETAKNKDYLFRELTRLGLEVLPSETNFFLIEVGDGRALREQLLRKGILVRDCASFGLPAYVRVSARTLPECRRLVEALAELL